MRIDHHVALINLHGVNRGPDEFIDIDAEQLRDLGQSPQFWQTVAPSHFAAVVREIPNNPATAWTRPCPCGMWANWSSAAVNRSAKNARNACSTTGDSDREVSLINCAAISQIFVFQGSN